MALFKVYRGETLPSDAHAGYGYVSIGASATVGTWYVDVDTSTIIAGNRFPIAAPGLVHQGSYYELPDITQVVKTEIDAPDKAYTFDLEVSSQNWTSSSGGTTKVKTCTVSSASLTGNAPPIITLKEGSTKSFGAISKVVVDTTATIPSLTFFVPTIDASKIGDMTLSITTYG